MRSSFEYRVSFDDYLTAARYAGKRLAQSARAPWQQWALFLGSGIASACATGLLISLATTATGPGPNLALLAGLAVFALCAILALSPQITRRLGLRRVFAQQGDWTSRLEIEADGLRVTRGALESRVKWGALRGVEEVGSMVLVFLDDAVYITIPGNAFLDASEKEELVQFLRAKASDAPTGATQQLELGLESSGSTVQLPSTARDRPGLIADFLSGLGRNLRAGGRLLVFRNVEPAAFRLSIEQLVVLIAIGVLLSLLGDMAEGGLPGRFNVRGLPGAVFDVPLLLLAGYIVARLEHEARLVLLVPIAVLAASTYISIVGTVLYVASDAGWLDLSNRAASLAYGWGPYVWAMLVTVFLLRRFTHRPAPVRWINLAVITVLVFVPAYYVPRTAGGPLWVGTADSDSDPEEEKRWYAVASEEGFYAQHDLLQRSLAVLAPERPGVEDLYFVGVAGYAAEDVFRKELDVIEPLFEQRFGTTGRSINLINNPGTALQSPIASVTSLERTLVRLGRIMNREEDVLFLYLTSHGSHDHRFALEFWPLRLRDLEPAALRRMLDISGIRWRVIVISACYSGGFIEPLKDEHTLIVTAADPQHMSFGCGAESEFTYFGKAYFDEALRTTHSFIGAFDAARATITARERSEGREPSNPQMFVGVEIKRKLEGMEKRWSGIEKRD